MTFPVHFNVFGLHLHPHPVLEVVAYAVGFQTYLALRRREKNPAIAVEPMLWLIVAAVFGALFGSKILAWLESPQQYLNARHDLRILFAGKTIVGGLLGGWIGVEIGKRILHITRRTGDLYVFPLMLGIAIGRIGCFLTGLDDHTHGKPTALRWGVDFGDGIPRHPTQLYETAFVLLLGIALVFKRGAKRDTGFQPVPVAPHGLKVRVTEGSRFRLFLLSYLLFRFAVEFIKPTWNGYAGLSAIQWASLAGATACAIQLRAKRAAT